MRRAALVWAVMSGLGLAVAETCRGDDYSPHYFHVGPVYNHIGHLDYHPFCAMIGHDNCIPLAPIPPCPYGSYRSGYGARYVYPNRAPRDFWMYH